MSHSRESLPKTSIYTITSPNGSLLISLKDGHPRGHLVVEKQTKSESAPNQQWAVIDHLDENHDVYTFKSQIKEFEGREIPPAKRPYARNSLADKPDPYLHGGVLDLYTTFKIRPSWDDPTLFMIVLPGRPRAWTIADHSTNIILDEYDENSDDIKENQLWKFEKIDSKL